MVLINLMLLIGILEVTPSLFNCSDATEIEGILSIITFLTCKLDTRTNIVVFFHTHFEFKR